MMHRERNRQGSRIVLWHLYFRCRKVKTEGYVHCTPHQCQYLNRVLVIIVFSKYKHSELNEQTYMDWGYSHAKCMSILWYTHDAIEFYATQRKIHWFAFYILVAADVLYARIKTVVMLIFAIIPLASLNFPFITSIAINWTRIHTLTTSAIVYVCACICV